MKVLAADIEAKGLYDVVNTLDDLHCLCSIDMETNKVWLFHNHPEFDNAIVLNPYDNKEYTIPKRDGDLNDGVLFWENRTAEGYKLAIHNSICYDMPVINKLFPNNRIAFESYWDTFIQSKLQWFERPCPKGAKSPHGLKAYGIKFGVNKPEVNDWSTIDAFKLHRCIEDCKIQAKTYEYLERERLHLKQSYGVDFSTALKIEALYAKECFIQEQNGILIDIPHAKACIEDLDNKILELKEKITPLLPPTLKGVGIKLSRKEIAEALGLNPDRVKEQYVERKKNGEVEKLIEKPYFKPITKLYTKAVVIKYSAFNISLGISPIFEKRKEVLEWIKANHPETKTKDWQIDKEEVVTQLIKPEIAKWFNIEQTNLEFILGSFTKVEIEKSTLDQSEIVKEYLISLGWKDAEDWNLKTDAYDNYIKVETETRVVWPLKASPENQMVKIIPKGGLLVSSPKLTEGDYAQLPEGVGQDIARFNTYQHRRRFLLNVDNPEEKGLLAYLRPDGRVGAGVNNFATRSGRG